MSEIISNENDIQDVALPSMTLEAQLKQLETGEASLDILVELAKAGEIDPWDIDLERITDKYLKAISQRNVAGKDDTLREAGKAIFYASVLLRMKSDILTHQANEALNIGHGVDGFADLLDEDLESVYQVSFRDLEKVLRKRNISKIKRFRKITLADLLEALQEAKREEEDRAIRKAQQRFEFLNDYEIVEPELGDDISELTHSENLEEAITRANAFVAEYLLDEKGVEFEELVRVLGSWSNAFLAITYLSHDHKVCLEQQEIYGEMWIHGPQS